MRNRPVGQEDKIKTTKLINWKKDNLALVYRTKHLCAVLSLKPFFMNEVSSISIIIVITHNCCHSTFAWSKITPLLTKGGSHALGFMSIYLEDLELEQDLFMLCLASPVSGDAVCVNHRSIYLNVYDGSCFVVHKHIIWYKFIKLLAAELRWFLKGEYNVYGKLMVHTGNYWTHTSYWTHTQVWPFKKWTNCWHLSHRTAAKQPHVFVPSHTGMHKWKQCLGLIEVSAWFWSRFLFGPTNGFSLFQQLQMFFVCINIKVFGRLSRLCPNSWCPHIDCPTADVLLILVSAIFLCNRLCCGKNAVFDKLKCVLSHNKGSPQPSAQTNEKVN